MIYLISDIHGQYDKYLKMLKRIHLKDEDTLYVLGDAIDRGPDGIKVLQDMASRPNVVGMIGNHELNALMALPAILRLEAKGESGVLTEEDADSISLWLNNGAEPTIKQFLKLSERDRMEVNQYLLQLAAFVELEVGGKKYVLVHTGPENFSPDKALTDYTLDELTFSRPDPESRYYEDKTIIFGHTPTPILFNMLPGHAPSDDIFHADTFIDIDCGAAFKGGRLACLCLDTMDEFYV